MKACLDQARHMLVQKTFEDQLDTLHLALLKSNPGCNVEIRCISTPKARYLYIEGPGTEMTISHHPSYQEPVLHIRFIEEKDESDSIAPAEDLEDFDPEEYDPVKPRYTNDLSKVPNLFELISEAQEYLTLDYHTLLQDQIWFYLHPCMTNEIIPEDTPNYLLAWMSVYGKYFGLNMDVVVISEAISEASHLPSRS